MGTTADKLQAILDSKNAIKDKFNLPDDLPFSQYAENITNSSGEGDSSGEYYLCTYVNRTYETGEFTVSGLPTDIFINLSDWDGNLYPEEYRTKNPNGTYAPYYTADSLSEWKFRNEHGTVVYWNGEWMAWVFAPFAQGETDYWLSTFPVRASSSWEDPKYPWDSSLEWTLNDSAFSPSIAPVIPSLVEPYWNGYKLILNESGKYDIDYSEEHKLTYTDYMPIAGCIYNKSCTMEIGDLYIDERAKYACPRNQNFDVSDEWAIIASSEYEDGNHAATQAFYDNTNLAFKPASADGYGWIMWRSKGHKTLVKRLEVTMDDWKNYELQAKNTEDETWVRIVPDSVTDCTESYVDGKKKSVVIYRSNYKFYTDHRIRVDSAYPCWNIKAFIFASDRTVPTALKKFDKLSHLVFHAPLDKKDNPLPTGQNAYYSGTYSFTEVDGRKCVYLENGGHIYSGLGSVTRMPFGDSGRTIGFWVKAATATPARSGIFGYGVNNKGQAFNIELRDGTVGLSSSSTDDSNYSFTTTFDASSWHFIVVVHHPDGRELCYIDGVCNSDDVMFDVRRNTHVVNGAWYIGRLTNNATYPFTGYVANVQVYDVALDPWEVAEWYANDGKVID